MTAERHHRQRILSEVGEAGQQRLEGGSVAIVGLGGLGSPVALYLAAAGRLLILDSALRLDARQESVRASNVEAIAAEYDVVVDATDSFETKFLLNDAAVLLRKPLVHGAVLRWGGQATTVLPDGPCLRCLFREPPDAADIETCEEAGIIGAATGVVGSVQAEEVLKVILNVGTPLSGRIFQHDGLRGETRITTFPRDPDCPVCSPRARITDLTRYAEQVSPRGHVRG